MEQLSNLPEVTQLVGGPARAVTRHQMPVLTTATALLTVTAVPAPGAACLAKSKNGDGIIEKGFSQWGTGNLKVSSSLTL